MNRIELGAGIMSALFVFAAGVQFNDPDPAIWILAYSLAAALSAAFAVGKRWVRVNTAAAIVFLIDFIRFAPSLLGAESAAFSTFQMQAPAHEEPREAIGLALCTFWCAVLAWRSKAPTPRLG